MKATNKKQETYTINGLSTLLGMDRRTIARRLVGVLPDGEPRLFRVQTLRTLLTDEENEKTLLHQVNELMARDRRSPSPKAKRA